MLNARVTAGVMALGVLVAAPSMAGAQGDPDSLVQSHLRQAVVTLPEGMSISPSAAGGLRACSDEQLKLGSTEPEECPDASKIGTAAASSALLEEPLQGSILVRTSAPGELFRIALTLSLPSHGVRIKLPGAVRPDPVTGRITVTFDRLPQLPFSGLQLRFNDGPRAVLATPLDCGTYSIRGLFAPWSGTTPVAEETLFDIGGHSCPRTLPFDPEVVAGTVDPLAGTSTPFIFRVRRADGRQELRRVELELPPGLAAVVRGVPLCPAGQAAAGSCGEETRIGTVTVGAGPGPTPFYLSGRVFLTDGYRNGEFGLAIVVPAVAGPFDLGTVVVRAAVHVDPRTAQLRVDSDPVPRILEGVPLRLRDLHLAIDRAHFFRNPTSCRPMQVNSLVEAFQGASAPSTMRFQATDCSGLRFRPRLSVRLTSRGRPLRDKRIGLRARLRTRTGDANLRRVAFTLPPRVAFDALRRRQPLCRREDLFLRRCPGRTRVGSARAATPLLNRPLKGPVYFVRGAPVPGQRFPKLAVLLEGENGIRIDLLGSTDVDRSGLRTTFAPIPDVPVTDFRFNLRRGLLTPTRNLCRRRPRAALVMIGQNGRRVERTQRVGVSCKRTRARKPRPTG